MSRSGRKRFSKAFWAVVQRVAAVHEVEQEMLLLLEAVIAQADRILDDEVGASLVALRHDVKVGAAAQTHLLASFEITGGSGSFVHGIKP